MNEKLVKHIAMCMVTLLSLCGAVEAQTPTLIYKFAGGGGSTGDDFIPGNAQVTSCVDICKDASGNIYFTQSTARNRIRKITPGGIITTVAGSGAATTSADGTLAATSTVNLPTAIQTDAAGNIYFVETGSNRVRKITASTGLLSTFAGDGTSGTATGESIQATATSMNPACIRFDATGANMYVADQLTNKIRKIDVATGLITTVAGTGTAGSHTDGTVATSANLRTPRGIALDGSGNIYLSEAGTGSHIVSVVKTDGKIYTIAGTGATGTGSNTAAAGTTVALADPYMLSLDGNGDLLIADQTNNRVRKLNVTTGIIQTIAGTGTSGETGDGGNATAATLTSPSSAYVDATGNIFICDGPGTRIRVMTNCSTPTVTATSPTVVFGNSTTVTASGATNYTWLPSNTLSASTGTSVTSTPTAVATVTYSVVGVTSACINTVTTTVTANNAVSNNVWLFAGSGSTVGDGGQATSAQVLNAVDLAIDAAGNKYIAQNGTASHRIRKVTSTGVITTIAGTTAGTAGTSADGVTAATATVNAVQSLVVDGAGNVYFAESGSGKIRKITAATGLLSTIAGGGGAGATADGLQATATNMSPYTIRFDASGNNLYFTCASTHRARKIDMSTGLVTTVAGNGTSGSFTNGAIATAASLNAPTGLGIDGSGNIYIVQTGADKLMVVKADGKIYNVAGTGTGGSNGNAGIATSIQLNDPNHIAVDADGNIIVADYGNNKVRKIYPATGMFTTFANNAGNTPELATSVGTPATATAIQGPAGVTVDADGNVYLCNKAGGYVKVVGNCTTPTVSTVVASPTITENTTTTFTASGATSYSWSPAYGLSATTGSSVTVTGYATTTYTVTGATGFCSATTTATITVNPMVSENISTFAGGGGSLGDGGAASASQVDFASDVCVDASGNRYIAQGNTGNRIRKVTLAGTITTIAGNGTSLMAGDGTVATAATVRNPVSVAIDGAGNVYFAEAGAAGRIRRINVSTGKLETVAGGGVSILDNVAATTQNINPSCVRFDAAGDLYLCDVANHKVRKVTMSTGNITTVAGSGSVGSFTDGAAATASNINGPRGILFDGSGNIYLSLSGNNKVAVVKTDGKIYTVAGTGTAGSDGDGVATAKRLNAPGQLAMDSDGNIFIADEGSNRVRKLYVNVGMMTTFAGTGTASETGDGSPATAATLNAPISVVRDADGNTYISDKTGGRVRYVGAPCITPTVNVTVAPSGTVCPSTSHTLTATGGGSTYVWTPTTFLSSGVGATVTVTPTVTTTYTVTGGSGTCTSTATVTVNVHPTPGAITGTLSVCRNSTVTLNCTPAGGTWSTGSGNISINSSTGVVTGNTAGNAAVSYTNLNGCISTATVTVNALPTVSAGTGASICPATTATLTATGASTYAWAGENLVTNAGATVTATPTVTTTYTVTGTDGNGCVGTATKTISILPFAISASSSGTICAGGTATLTATGGTTYTWTPGTTLSATTGAIVNATPTLTTTYTVTGTDGTCTQNSSVTVSVNPLPAISGTAVVCRNATTTLTGTPNTGAWSTVSANASVNSSTGVVTGVNAGMANITYTLPTTCFAVREVTVNALPTVSAGTGASICPATTATMTATGATTYAWSGNNLVTNAGATVTATPTVATTYTVTGIDGNGCVNSATKTISILPFLIGVSSSGPICSGGSATLTATGGTSYTWTADASLSGTTGAVVIASPTVATTYTVTGTDGTCTGSASVTVNVGSNPSISGTPLMCRNATATLTGTPAGGNWTSGGGNASVNASSGVVTGINAGNVNITYTALSGCFSFVQATVLALPSVSAGIGSTICPGASSTLTASGATSYTWAGSALSATTGISVTATPTVTTVYTVTGTDANNCSNIATNTVNVTAITLTVSPTTAVCPGSFATLTANGAGTYVWTPATGLSATTGASVVVTPTVNTTYTVVGTVGACTQSATVSVTIGGTLDPITGTATLCKTSTTTLNCTPAGGSWSSSNTAIATVGSTTGVVFGVNNGTATITYSKDGCISVKDVTVQATPAIGGVPSICLGATYTMTNAVAGGTWESSDPLTASIDVNTGEIEGLQLGTVVITYRPSTGCAATRQVTVGALSQIESAPWACLGQFTALNHPVTGGVWSSSNPARATIDATTGVVYGVSLGNFYITYTVASGCARVLEMAVQTFPMSFIGASTVCKGSMTTLSNTTISGTWASSNTSIATVDTNTGSVIGINDGNVTLTYKFHACVATKAFTVDPLPSDIVGPNSICEGSTATYTSLPTGGTWASSLTSLATIGNTTGVVTGVSFGSLLLSYTAPVTGCVKTKAIAVNARPGTLSGVASVCVGGTTTITTAANGGTWTSSSGAVASIGSTLAWSTTVTGLAAGTTDITVSSAEGCSRSLVLTVNAAPSTIVGDDVVCVGRTIQLTNATPSGTWSSNRTDRATISSAGLVTGISPGTVIITYSTNTICFITKQITVNSIPSNIVAPYPPAICVGNMLTLTHAEPGGTWSSSTPSRATIDATSGQVTGVSAGPVYITYSINSGCYSTVILSVNPAPAAITGNASVCQGLSTTLSNAVAFGIWTSSNTAVAVVPSAPGTVYGISDGMATITYTIPTTGCYTTRQVTVNTLPGTITGATSMCAGASETYTCAPAGGTWSSSMTSVGTIDASSGAFTAVAGGSTVITYTLGSGCYKTQTVNVNAIPNTITGTLTACVGGTTTVNTTTAGVTWSSVGSAVGSIAATTGTVSLSSAKIAAISEGTLTVTATKAGCSTSVNVIVTASPTISGNALICPGGSTLLTPSAPGGTWTSSATLATVTSTGLVTALAVGSANISYKISDGCFAVKQVTVSATPAVVTGPNIVCIGSDVQLSHAVPDGTWTSSLPTRGSVSATGVVTGVSAGSFTITYSTAAGCYRTFAMTVNPLPTAISSLDRVCEGSTIKLTNSTAGGSWISGNTSVATISASLGVLTGVDYGTATISYKLVTTGCMVTKVIAVDSTPTPIAGPSAICQNSAVTYSSMPVDGTWTSSATLKATIGSTTGVASGLAMGTTILSYTAPGSGCSTARTITVNTVPAAITGPTTVCAGNGITLTSITAGQTWSSTTPAAVITPSTTTTALVTGMAPGITTISYTNVYGCASRFTVNVSPAMPAITGDLVVCPTRTVALGFAGDAPSGTWSSALTTKATVSASGVVTGVNAGVVNISYISSPGCYKWATVTINAVPAAITGPTSVCVGDSIDMNHTTAGGLWTTTGAAAIVNPANGFVTGMAAGTPSITYAISSGCWVTTTVNVKPSPAAITGELTVAPGSTTTLTNTTAGGTWSSGATAIATIGTTSGVAMGVNSGTAVITYRVSATQCYRTALLTVGTPLAKPAGSGSFSESKIAIYPNPTSGMLTVEAAAEGTFTVYTLDGKQLQQYSTQAPSTTIQMPTNLAAGVYMCRYEGADGSAQIVRIVYHP